MTMRASLIIEAKERASSVFTRIGQKARGMARDLRGTERQATRADSALRRIGGGATTRITAFGRRMVRLARELKLVERAAYATGYGIGWMIKKASRFALDTAKWAALAGIGLGTAGIAGMIRVTSEFEQFQVVLENTEGSADGARRAMDWVKNFAKKTPYELNEVMEAFVALRAYGIDPTDGSLEALGNTASGMSKPLMQAVEMIADAATGEFERLKEFGIRAKAEGDRVTFSYMRNGRQMTATSRNTAADIQRTLMGVMGERFGGMMERQSRTLAGIWSNIKDYASDFMLRIGQAGIFDRIKDRAQAMLDQLDRWAADGSLQKWADDISKSLTEVFDWAMRTANEVNWQQVGADAKVIAEGLWAGARALAQIVLYAQRAKGLFDALGLGTVINPVGGALGVLGDADRAWQQWRQPSRTAGPALPRPAARTNGSMLYPRATPQRTQGPWLPSRGPRVGAAAPVQVGGELLVRVAATPGTQADVVTMRSKNRDVPIRSNRGQARTA